MFLVSPFGDPFMANFFCISVLCTCAHFLPYMPSEAIVFCRSSCASFCRLPCELGPSPHAWLRVAQVLLLYIKSRLLQKYARSWQLGCVVHRTVGNVGVHGGFGCGIE